MKKIKFAMLSVALVAGAMFSGASVHAATIFKIADSGSIAISKDGSVLSLLDKQGNEEDFIDVHEEHINNAKVAIYVNPSIKTDMVAVTVRDNDHQFVTFARYNGDKLLGRWNVDATRYMSFVE